jgi:hypothetical protein
MEITMFGRKVVPASVTKGLLTGTWIDLVKRLNNYSNNSFRA